VTAELAILGALALPLLGAAMIALANRSPNAREAATLVTGVALLGLLRNRR